MAKCTIHGKEDCWVCTDPDFERFPYLEKIKDNPFVDKKLEEDLDAYREIMTQDPNTPTSKITEFDKRRLEIRERQRDMYDRTQAFYERMQMSEGIDWISKGLTAGLLTLLGFMIIIMICGAYWFIKVTFGGI